ncbi:MAG: isoprenylcysteine carboxylmethyltransferase family protein [Thermoplasmata archaeon]|nr:isoprenylcysteine carboxylmethyltransferase family protein [Thermoplasmata archaeon]
MASAFLATGALGVAFALAYATWVLSELFGAVLLPYLRWGPSTEVRRADRGSRVAIVLGIVVATATASELAHAGYATFPVPVVEVGIALMMAGVALRQWAIAVLGRFFNTSVRVVEGHSIVERGPYRLVRHPSYTGALVTLLGVGLAGGSWEGVLVLLAVASGVFGYRIRVEERLLVEQLGRPYEEYRRRTKRMLPYVL